MADVPIPREKIALRLKRIAGQIKGCARMVTDEKECSDILTQMAAARGALSAVAAQVLTNFTHICLEKEKKTGENPYDSLARVFALWTSGPSDSPAGQANNIKRQRKPSGGKHQSKRIKQAGR